MTSYLVKTPGNPDYSGKVFGIPFSSGRAIVSPETLNPKLGWTTEQIATSMKNDFGYDVLELAAPADKPLPIPESTEPIPASAVKAEVEDGALMLKEHEPGTEAPAPAPEPENNPVNLVEDEQQEEQPKKRNASKRRN